MFGESSEPFIVGVTYKMYSYMLTDEKIYHDPFEFIPERFLPKPEGYGEPLPTAAFGFGRR